MKKPVYPVVLFDLDGTLTDPYEGIANCFRYTLEVLKYPQPDDAVLRSWIGPPLHETFTLLLGDEALGAEAVRLYRSRYEPIGAFENRVYEGIPQLLNDLRSAGCRLGLATSKLEDSARAILDHFELTAYFAHIVGASRDNRLSAKGDIIRLALEHIAPSNGSAVMVGDREHDVHGARANGIDCIGVAYGYGGAAELHAAGAFAVAEDVPALRHMLLGDR